MEKIYREGIDIGVALTVATKRSTARANAAKATKALHTAPAAAAGAAAAPGNVAVHPEPTSMRSRLKRALRPPVRFAFRLLKPLLSPPAFRMRRYLGREVQQELAALQAATQGAIEQMSANMLREIQISREMLRQELASAQQHAATELDQRLQRIEALQLDGVRDILGNQETLLTDLHASAASVAAAVAAAAAASAASAAQNDSKALAADLLPRLERIDHLSQTAAQRVDVLASQLAPRFDRIEQYSYTTARRVIVNSGPDDVLMKTEAGYLLCPSTETAIVACLAESGDLERGTRLLIQRMLRPGDVYIDVGAHLGINILAAGVAMQAQGRIVAFEPSDATRIRLEKTLYLNGYAGITEIHQAAVSDRAGEQSLYLGKISGHHSLYALPEVDAASAAPATVRTVRLDEVIAPATPVTLIKIDAEGAELEVLHSAAATIRANPEIALIVEFGPSHLQRRGHTAMQWLAAFAALGLEYRAIDPLTGVLERWTLAQLEAVHSINLFFARPGAQCWSKVIQA
jgi:FkbM family methyltransferase